MDISTLKSHLIWPEIKTFILAGNPIREAVSMLRKENDFIILKKSVVTNLLRDAINDFMPEEKALMEENTKARYEKPQTLKKEIKKMEKSIEKIPVALTKSTEKINQIPEIQELQKLIDILFIRISLLSDQEKDGNDRTSKPLETAIEQTIKAINEKFKIRQSALGINPMGEGSAPGNTNWKPSHNILKIDKFLFNANGVSPEVRKEAQAKILPLLQKAKQKKLEETNSDATKG